MLPECGLLQRPDFFMSRRCFACFTLAVLNLFGHLLWGAQAKELPRALVQYVQDAKRLGVKDADIKAYALRAGWNAAAVDQAMAMNVARPDDAALAAAQTGPRPDLPAAETPEGYRIGSGDVLQIIVWKEQDASVPSTMVRPDGMIAVPLLKEVHVLGMTPKEAEKAIAAGLSKYIRDADVTVVVSAINSVKAYVIGAVRVEGPILLRYRMTILQALSEVGGLTEYAKRKKIYLMRTENGRQYRLPFNYEAVIKGENMEQNITLMPNDTIVVPQ